MNYGSCVALVISASRSVCFSNLLCDSRFSDVDNANSRQHSLFAQGLVGSGEFVVHRAVVIGRPPRFLILLQPSDNRQVRNTRCPGPDVCQDFRRRRRARWSDKAKLSQADAPADRNPPDQSALQRDADWMPVRPRVQFALRALSGPSKASGPSCSASLATRASTKLPARYSSIAFPSSPFAASMSPIS